MKGILKKLLACIMAEDVFEDCGDVIIYAPKGGYALNFAEKNDLEFIPYCN